MTMGGFDYQKIFSSPLNEKYSVDLKKMNKNKLKKTCDKLMTLLCHENELNSSLQFQLTQAKGDIEILWKEIYRIREIHDQYYKELEFARNYIKENMDKVK